MTATTADEVLYDLQQYVKALDHQLKEMERNDPSISTLPEVDDPVIDYIQHYQWKTQHIILIELLRILGQDKP